MSELQISIIRKQQICLVHDLVNLHLISKIYTNHTLEPTEIILLHQFTYCM